MQFARFKFRKRNSLGGKSRNVMYMRNSKPFCRDCKSSMSCYFYIHNSPLDSLTSGNKESVAGTDVALVALGDLVSKEDLALVR